MQSHGTNESNDLSERIVSPNESGGLKWGSNLLLSSKSNLSKNRAPSGKAQTNELISTHSEHDPDGAQIEGTPRLALRKATQTMRPNRGIATKS